MVLSAGAGCQRRVLAHGGQVRVLRRRPWHADRDLVAVSRPLVHRAVINELQVLWDGLRDVLQERYPIPTATVAARLPGVARTVVVFVLEISSIGDTTWTKRRGYTASVFSKFHKI